MMSCPESHAGMDQEFVLHINGKWQDEIQLEPRQSLPTCIG